jgi:acetyl-CoA carboxylase carboxyl transferase subunit alpha
MISTWLDFERQIIELERRIEDLKNFTSAENIEISDELSRLEKKAERLRTKTYSKLTRWQRVQLARHPRRPYTLDYVERIFDDFTELHGDRAFADDESIVGGLARLDGRAVVIVGHQKGRDTKENIRRNFGMPHPEGYRKALRIMEIGARFGAPIITFVDTPGAYPGIGAEERGQSEAIARNLREMAGFHVPIVVVIIGEGGSGGALALGVGDRVLMMEYAIYSVISPEGCAAILWRDRVKAPEAAEALKLTSQDLASLEVVDEIVPEPMGGAHRGPDEAAVVLRDRILANLRDLERIPPDRLVDQRCQKFMDMGFFEEPSG